MHTYLSWHRLCSVAVLCCLTMLSGCGGGGDDVVSRVECVNDRLSGLPPITQDEAEAVAAASYTGLLAPLTFPLFHDSLLYPTGVAPPSEEPPANCGPSTGGAGTVTRRFSDVDNSGTVSPGDHYAVTWSNCQEAPDQPTFTGTLDATVRERGPGRTGDSIVVTTPIEGYQSGLYLTFVSNIRVYGDFTVDIDDPRELWTVTGTELTFQTSGTGDDHRLTLKDFQASGVRSSASARISSLIEGRGKLHRDDFYRTDLFYPYRTDQPLSFGSQLPDPPLAIEGTVISAGGCDSSVTLNAQGAVSAWHFNGGSPDYQTWDEQIPTSKLWLLDGLCCS